MNRNGETELYLATVVVVVVFPVVVVGVGVFPVVVSVAVLLKTGASISRWLRGFWLRSELRCLLYLVI